MIKQFEHHDHTVWADEAAFGHHRRFCLWSHIGRGSLTHPGLVLGLDVGGCCRGVAFLAGAFAALEKRTPWAAAVSHCEVGARRG